MYKNVCHKIIVYVLVGCLSFGVPATTYYKSVHAIEFLGGALAFEEALKWLLAIVGVTAAGSVASQVDWSEVREQCVEVQLHNGASQAQVSEWWAKLAKGTLDKASSCWTSFLEWSDSLVANNSGGGSGISSFPTSGTSVINYLADFLGYSNVTVSSDVANLNNIYGYCASSLNSDGCFVYFFTSSDNISISVSQSGTGGYIYFTSSNTFNVYRTVMRPNRVNESLRNLESNVNSYRIGVAGIGSAVNYGSIVSGGSVTVEDSTIYVVGGSGSGSVPVEYDWQSAIDVARENLNLLNRDLPDENASEVAIPMPGLADSDNEVSADAYDNIVDAINDGTITLDDGIAQIQDLLHVLVIDDTTDIVQPVRPDPDTGEDQTKEDVIKENKSNMGFTLAGLEKVFPFCIPFDIYAFMTLLVAEPVAPEFDFPIKSVNNQTEEIHIDLSPFEPVAVVVRYIFDFLFIIGLALMTRSLIGGGSSD